MDVYKSDRIRNVVLLGHGGVGKTSLVEAMAYLAGITSRMGKVTDGNTISDFDKEEIKRKFSISATMVPIEWKQGANKYKINVLDTPGFFDFVGEAEEAASAADAAVIVISGKAGVQVGVQKAWALCDRYSLPRMVYVTDMDMEDVSYQGIIEALQDSYGTHVVPITMPIREGGKFTGYVNIVKNAGRKFTDKDNHVDCPIPESVMDTLEGDRETLLESVAETSEEFMEKYFGGEEFTEQEIADALAGNVASGDIVPVECGSPVNLQGVRMLLDDIITFFPSPVDRKISGKKDGADFTADYDASKPKSAKVFKTIADPFLGKYSLIKVCSGVIKNDDVLYNVTQETEEKLSKLYVMCGSKPIEVQELQAGDIGAIAKLNSAKTGDSFSTQAEQISYEPAQLSKPYASKQYRAVNKGDIDKIAQGLARLMQEDQTLKVVNDAANRQSLIFGIGDMHLDVVASKLQSRYKVDIELDKPKVAFRETIKKKSDVDSKYKKQSGGHGQYGHVKMRFEPSYEMETPYIFEEEVVGGAVPKNYFPAVEKGLADAVVSGPLAAYPVVGVKAVLYDGSYHPVDSSEMAFKTATSMAFKKGFMEAGPILLEPIVSMKVTVPDRFTGDVMGDLNKRRGRVLGMNPDHKGNTIVEAEVPELEIYGYSNTLRSMTGGTGDFEYEFLRYEQTPADVQAQQIEERKSELTQDEE